MLACARIGAIHNVVFGGFAAKELSVRMDASTVSLLQAQMFNTCSDELFNL